MCLALTATVITENTVCVSSKREQVRKAGAFVPQSLYLQPDLRSSTETSVVPSSSLFTGSGPRGEREWFKRAMRANPSTVLEDLVAFLERRRAASGGPPLGSPREGGEPRVEGDRPPAAGVTRSTDWYDDFMASLGADRVWFGGGVSFVGRDVTIVTNVMKRRLRNRLQSRNGHECFCTHIFASFREHGGALATSTCRPAWQPTSPHCRAPQARPTPFGGPSAPAPPVDPYATLGVPKDAPIAAVREAYRRKAQALQAAGARSPIPRSPLPTAPATLTHPTAPHTSHTRHGAVRFGKGFSAVDLLPTVSGV